VAAELIENARSQIEGGFVDGLSDHGLPGHWQRILRGRNRQVNECKGIAVEAVKTSASAIPAYTAACSGSLSAEWASRGIGMITITEVPEPLDSIFISP
jgi:hypothetical protein